MRLNAYFALSVFALSLFCSQLMGQATTGGVITLANVQGEVVIEQADGQQFPAENRARIGAGATVVTSEAASAVLVFSNGTTLTVGSNSSLSVEEFLHDTSAPSMEEATERGYSNTRLNLGYGEIVGKVRKLNTQRSTFTIETPVGTAGIRGTEFLIEARQVNGEWRINFGLGEGRMDIRLRADLVRNLGLTELEPDQELQIRAQSDDDTGEISILGSDLIEFSDAQREELERFINEQNSDEVQDALDSYNTDGTLNDQTGGADGNDGDGNGSGDGDNGSGDGQGQNDGDNQGQNNSSNRLPGVPPPPPPPPSNPTPGAGGSAE